MDLFQTIVWRVFQPLIRLAGFEWYWPHLTADGEKIDLIRPKHFDRLPNGTVLTLVTGEKVVKGKGVIHRNDTLCGYMAYGFPSIAEGTRVYAGRRRKK